MILGTDVNGKVWLVADSTDSLHMPTEFNGVAITASLLTDAEEAEYLALDPNRAGTMFINGGFYAIPPLPVVPRPDPQGFAQAIKVGVGGIVEANALAVAYPLFFDAVSLGNWPDVTALILDAQQKGILSPSQYAEFQAAAQQFNTGMVLP